MNKTIEQRLSILEKRIGIKEDYAHPTPSDVYKELRRLGGFYKLISAGFHRGSTQKQNELELKISESPFKFQIRFQLIKGRLSIFWNLYYLPFRYNKNSGKIRIDSEVNIEDNEFLDEVDDSFGKVLGIYSKYYLQYKNFR